MFNMDIPEQSGLKMTMNIRYGHSRIEQTKPGYYRSVTVYDDGEIVKTEPEHYGCLMIDDVCIYCRRKA